MGQVCVKNVQSGPHVFTVAHVGGAGARFTSGLSGVHRPSPMQPRPSGLRTLTGTVWLLGHEEVHYTSVHRAWVYPRRGTRRQGHGGA